LFLIGSSALYLAAKHVAGGINIDESYTFYKNVGFWIIKV